MHERDLTLIRESLYAIGHINEYVEGFKTISELIADSKTYDAVLMNFIVLGEAASRISDEGKTAIKNVDWRAMKDFRNFLAHDYFGVDENIIWAAIKHELPRLKEEFESYLSH
jgi:uncharacterized protein with HEPN domain